MAYSDFVSIQQLSQKFDIRVEKSDFESFKDIKEITPSERCRLDILESQKIPNMTEKAKSELIIMPVLREVMRQTNWSFSLFSGFTFDVDSSQGLNGVCDYILSSDAKAADVTAPIFSLVEAKNRGLEEGIAQAGAEMYAAQIFNQKAGKPLPVMYGCVTNAFDWLFLRMENQNLYIDNKRYFIDESTFPKLLGVLCHIATSNKIH